ncbi:hypothetical protein [Prolixibacter sp. NT017]|uniref:hypothetical protein n=1 Tax=Prolixibacter sp. NT017 TaxID=2652390 RepID=UPI001298F14D|nr:hypothetical protein [Prolixibacter sp. NT017]
MKILFSTYRDKPFRKRPGYGLKGGALYFAILVLLLLSVLSSFFILLERLWNEEDVQYIKNVELNDRIESAAEWLHADPSLVRPEETKELTLFEDSVFVEIGVRPWGMLRIANYRTQWHRMEKEYTELLAAEDEPSYALYLTDQNKYLSLVGQSSLMGKCQLPHLGIRSGNIRGRTFEGEKLVDGNVSPSDTRLPALSEHFQDFAAAYLNGDFTKQDSVIALSKVERNGLHQFSFHHKTCVINCGGSAYLDNVQLEGNAVVLARDTLVVSPGAQLENTILIARVIRVEDKVTGRFQAFATKEITIGKDCRLNYPSFLVCLNNRTPGKITFGKKSTVIGGIALNGKNEEHKNNLLFLDEDDHLAGTVYVNGDVHFTGRIDGRLYCNRFVIDTPRAFYENIIVDGIIDNTSTPALFGSFSVSDQPFQLKQVAICQ